MYDNGRVLYDRTMPKHTAFEELFSDFTWPGQLWSTKTSRVVRQDSGRLRSYNSTTDDKGMKLLIDLPGIDPTTVTLETTNDQLVVRGKDGDKAFSQKYTISRDFNLSSTKATLQHGRLEVVIARSKESSTNQVVIEIK